MSVKIKICGLTTLDDAQVALDAGADFLGFILYPKSPRYIHPSQVGELIAKLVRPNYVQTVGVFVNMPTDEVLNTLDQTGLDLAQLHGDETEADLAALHGRGYKAVRPANSETAALAQNFTHYPPPHAPQLLVDAYSPNAYGGTGHQADWSLASALARSTPRLLLAGGLTAGNVQEAIHSVAPWGVDVSSGVEHAPGQKDHDQVRAFIHNTRRTG
jgi:phosphoribosylanthranilate isomerase